MINRKCIVGLIVIAGLLGCGQKDKNKSDKEEESVTTVLLSDEVEVETETLRTIDFEHELVSNGRISAQEVAELRFVSGSGGNMPVKIFVQNGTQVNAGDAIAMLDTFLLSNSYSQASVNLQKAHLDLQVALIDQGYTLADSASIPEEVFRLASIRSGYTNARTQRDLAKYHLDNAVLRTPIAGTITNLFGKPFNPIDNSEPFCVVINERKPEIDFTILENELPMIKKGDRVKLQAYASPDIETTGTIIDINPSVDKNGMVRIKASVQPTPQLFNGMNMRIGVFRTLGKHWVVPKSAVVLRTNKQVIFTYKNGKAAWCYVQTGFENTTHYTVTSETLQEGDDVIFKGNEYLMDGTNVIRK